MPKHAATSCAEQLVQEIDDALGQSPALTDSQLDDVRRLRAELQEHCRSGEMERARQCRKLALKVIRSGAPVPE